MHRTEGSVCPTSGPRRRPSARGGSRANASERLRRRREVDTRSSRATSKNGPSRTIDLAQARQPLSSIVIETARSPGTDGIVRSIQSKKLSKRLGCGGVYSSGVTVISRRPAAAPHSRKRFGLILNVFHSSRVAAEYTRTDGYFQFGSINATR